MILLIISLSLIIILFFVLAPSIVDKTKNPVTQEQLKQEREDWYDAIPFIADLHCDALLWRRDLLKRNNYGHVDVPRMREANMAFQVFTIVSKVPKNFNIEENDDKTDQIGLLSFVQLRPVNTWFSVTQRALNQCSELHQLEANSQRKFRVVTNQKQLRQYVQDRQVDRTLTAGMLGLEGAHALGTDINNLQSFYNAGVRYLGLVHFFDNEWAGSAHGVKKGGLTQQGKQLVSEMERLKITIDLAHSSNNTIDDILSLTKNPIIVSHTGIKGVCNNQRNLPDTYLDEIGKRNGLVGIGLWETAVGGTDAKATVKTIRYVADKIGVDKVTLGSDFDGSVKTHFDVTGLPLIAKALQDDGFSITEIEMVMGGNIRDFFLANLPAE